MTSLSNIKFNIGRIHTCTEVEGPFKRLAIWFQGCDIGCPGCCNPELVDFRPAHIISLEKLLEIIIESKNQNDIEGVTFIGGEPSLQKNLHVLALELRKINLGTIMFSGHYLKELSKELIDTMDIIIDGPFIASKLDNTRRLIGSTNQGIHLLTKRYKEHVSWFFENNQLIQEINVMDEIYTNGDVIF